VLRDPFALDDHHLLGHSRGRVARVETSLREPRHTGMSTLLAVTLLAAIDAASAQRAFTELEVMCAADRGRLWGRTVCGPTVFADAQTREAVTEEGPATIPDSIGIANTAVDWNGVRWTMVMWPLPAGTIGRRVLLAHESFHRIQKDLGFPLSNPANAHLDSADGRYWMRLEWRALARALATRDESALADALAFRAKRRTLFPTAAEEERLLEMNEGLAEHTGFALAVPVLSERVAPLVKRLAGAEKGEAFARAFAYASGPAWGALIEMRDPRWTRTVKASDDLGELARRAWRVRAVPRPLAANYGGDALRAGEDARAEKKAAILAELRARFVDGPILVIPLEQMQFTFDPNTAQPFGDLGTVYPSMEVRDVWGKIVINGGGLISSDYKKLTVPADGKGWTLTLNEGWRVADGKVTRD
jgi:hypothetical protein